MSNWINTTSVGDWTNAANWSGGVPNGIGVNANFNITGAGGFTTFVEIPEFQTMRVGVINVTISGTYDMFIRGLSSDSGAGEGILAFDLGAGRALVAINNGPSTGAFQITSSSGLALQFASDTEFAVLNAGGLARISAPILAGAGDLYKSGAGLLEISGPNLSTSSVFIEGGILHAYFDESLGSGEVVISNNAVLRSDGTTIDNAIYTLSNAIGTAGSAQIVARSGQTLTLTGVLNHWSQGTLTFGSATDAGTIYARFSNITENATDQSFRIAGGALYLDNAFTAANLLQHAGSGAVQIEAGALLATLGHATFISNLDMNGGEIWSGFLLTGLNLVATVRDGVSQTGTIAGSNVLDAVQFNIEGSFSLAGVTFDNWTPTDFITIVGTNGRETVVGSSQNETMYGYGDSDYFIGNGGVDQIYAGDQGDTVELSDNNDGSVVDGGDGFDALLVSGSLSLGGLLGFETLQLNSGAVLILTGQQFNNGLASNANLLGSGTIVVNMSESDMSMISKGMVLGGGAAYDFQVTGTSGANVIKMLAGATSTINAGSGTDIVQGGDLVDIINGGADIDKIAGNGGADLLTGGGGADVFKYRRVSDSGIGANADLILDFVSGTDRLNFVRIDADAVTPGDQAFTFIGTAAFSGTGTAQIRYVDTGSAISVFVDVNGDANAEMEIVLANAGLGAGTLTAADFVL